MFEGTLTALVTPMKDGQIDVGALRDFCEWQIAEGIDGLVPCGTTGEAATMTNDECALVIRTAVEQAKGRVPVLAGAGANDTQKAIDASRIAAECGADGLLHVAPYYNKPPQRGLVRHYRALAQATKLPVVAYNVPSRTASDLLPDTVVELSQIAGIVGIKEATGSVARAQELIQRCPSDFSILSGDDFSALALALLGGRGVISVVANLAPRKTREMIAAARSDAVARARTLHYEILPLVELLFCDANPIAVKAGVAMLGYGDAVPRLPLVALDEENRQRLDAELSRLGLQR